MSAFTTFAYGVLLMATVTSAMPQDLDNLQEVDDVSSRSNHGKKLRSLEIVTEVFIDRVNFGKHIIL